MLQLGFAVGAAADRERSGRHARPLGRHSALGLRRRGRRSRSWRPDGSATGQFVDVAAVQGGGEQGTRAIDMPQPVVTERHLDATRTIAPDPELDSCVWPENVIDVVDFETSVELAAITAEAERLGVPLVVGITEDVAGGRDGSSTPRSSSRPTVAVTSRYDKVRRVPFGEYVPMRGFLEALGAPVDQVPTNAVAGTGRRSSTCPTAPASPWSSRGRCSSAAAPATASKHGGERPHQPDERLQLHRHHPADPAGGVESAASDRDGTMGGAGRADRVLRVRDADGDVIDRTAVSEQAVIRTAVELRTGQTWYVRIGDRPFIVALARRARRRLVVARRSPPDPRHRVLRPDRLGTRVGDVTRSTITVTGPSLTSATAISVRNRPVATVAPSRRSS